MGTTGAFEGVILLSLRPMGLASAFCEARNEMKAFSRGETGAAGLILLLRTIKAILLVSIGLLAPRGFRKEKASP